MADSPKAPNFANTAIGYTKLQSDKNSGEDGEQVLWPLTQNGWCGGMTKNEDSIHFLYVLSIPIWEIT